MNGAHPHPDAAQPGAPRGARDDGGRSEDRRPAPAPAPGAAPPEPGDPRLFVNRELSLLQFQWRVFEEVRDPANPLLERVRFLSIVSSNLEEFFMIRVAGLQQQVASGVAEASTDGLTPAEQLVAVRREALRLIRAMSRCLHEELVPALDAAGIHLHDHPQLTAPQLAAARKYFDEMVFPVLTPLAFDPGRPFPHISNLSLNLAVLVRDGEVERFARIKVPSTLPRLVPIGRSTGALGATGTTHHHHDFVWLEQLVAANTHRLFPGVEVVGVWPFHVTRNAEVLLQEMEAADLLATVEDGVRERRFGAVARLTVTPSMPARVRELLVSNLEVDSRDVFEVEAPLALSALSGLSSIERPDLRFPVFAPATPERLVGPEGTLDIFATIRQRDVLLHHPFDSFAPVVDFLRAAARDPEVLAIKMTLYRIGQNSPVVEALLAAAENRKQVAVLVELKARFDEESNIGWARRLEAEGVHVVYGLLGLKTHSKIALVVRREGDRLARYVHLSTGNYNAVTANVYTDLGLLTADPQVGEDATELFNYLTGYSRTASYRKLIVAPLGMRERILALVDREAAHARAGRGGHLAFKLNAVADRDLVDALVRAARAGVRVDLLARGVCGLRPGIPGATENVRVTSIVGRFLEHTRIYWFRNAGAEELFLGSADLMARNLLRRVELLFPVDDPALVRHLRDDVLELYLRDNVRARRMRPDGSYERVTPADGEERVDAQAILLARAMARREGEGSRLQAPGSRPFEPPTESREHRDLASGLKPGA